MSRPIVNPGTLYWTGEHWVNYLREPGQKTDSGIVSLWHTRYSAVGNGTLAFVDIPGEPGFRGLCTDNREITEFIAEWYGSLGSIYDFHLPIYEADITYDGDIRTLPSWIIQTNQDRIVVTWSQIQSPVILEAPGPEFKVDQDVFSLLFFSDGAEMILNGQPIVGKPFLRDIWHPSIGAERSSCGFALAETFTLMAEK